MRQGVQIEGAPRPALRDGARHRRPFGFAASHHEDADGVLPLHDVADQDLEEAVRAHNKAEARRQGPVLCDQRAVRQAGVQRQDGGEVAARTPTAAGLQVGLKFLVRFFVG